MKVAIVAPDYPPKPGGVSDYAARWAEAMAERGVELSVLTSPGARQEEGWRVDDTQARWGWRGLGSLLAKLRELAPDAVLVHYVPHLYEKRGLSLPIAFGVALMRLMGQRVVLLAHELYYGRHEGWRVQPFGWAQRLALWPLFWGSARVVVTVPDRLERMAALFPRWKERFELIPVGNNLDAASGVDGRIWRAAYGIPEGALVLLFMGIAHPSKELSSLSRALEMLAERGIEARLLMVGGARLAHPDAVPVGFLSAEEARAALACSDMALLPLADGASSRRTSLMNALASGLPLVSTFGANTDAALFPEKAVRLVPANDAVAFAQAVCDLAEDATARRALGAEGKAWFEAHFAWPVLAERWQSLLEKIAQH